MSKHKVVVMNTLDGSVHVIEYTDDYIDEVFEGDVMAFLQMDHDFSPGVIHWMVVEELTIKIH